MRIFVEPKKRPRSHWAAYQKALRRRELTFIRELHAETNRRVNYKLELQNVDSLLHHKLYAPSVRPSLEARKQALHEMITESLGK